MSSNEMLMHSGQLLDVSTFTDHSSLNINDLVRSLSYEFRFRAQSPILLNVARHSILVHDLVQSINKNAYVCLAALLHDIEEALTGDIITPVKTYLDTATALPEVNKYGALKYELCNLRERIIDKILPDGVFLPDYEQHKQLIDDMDHVALLIEAKLFHEVDNSNTLFSILQERPGYDLYLKYMNFKEVKAIEDAFINSLFKYAHVQTSLQSRCITDGHNFLEIFRMLVDKIETKHLSGN